MAKVNEPKEGAITQDEINDLLEGVKGIEAMDKVLESKSAKVKPAVKNHEVLSQSEIDQLLMAISSGPIDDDKPVERRRRIKIYDFKRPDVFSKEQLRTISSGAEYLARDWTTLLAHLTKSIAHIHVCSVDQLTYEETVRAIPTPTALTEFTIDGHKALLEMDPSITFYTASKVGVEYPESWKYDTVDDTLKIQKNRPLQDMECDAILNKVFDPMLKGAKRALTDYFLIDDPALEYSRVKHLEVNSQYCNEIRPQEMVCLITFDCKFLEGDEEFEGMINLCLSRSCVMHLINSYNEVIPYEVGPFNFGKVMETKVPIEVLLGGTSKSLNDIKDFKEGTIIELDKLAGEPVDIRVNGEILAKGEVVIIDENFGVRITDMV